MSDYQSPLRPKGTNQMLPGTEDIGLRGRSHGESFEAFQERIANEAAAKLAGPVLTLPTDSAERKNYPMHSGCLMYFPAALAGVSRISKIGNDKHNPGQPLHHARGKSTDHSDCIIRHLTDASDLLAGMQRGQTVTPEQVLTEVNQLAWRVLAYSQELHERFGAPMAPAAK